MIALTPLREATRLDSMRTGGQINIRVSEDDIATIRRAADIIGERYSSWVRELALAAAAVVLADPERAAKRAAKRRAKVKA